MLAAKAGLNLDELATDWPRTDVIPFESEQQYMATLHHNHAGHGAIYLKGAPEKVLSLCHREWRTDKPLDVECWKEVADKMAGRGLRVLAVAEKYVESRQTVLEYGDTQSDFVLLGLVGMMDPPREEAIQAVARCRAAGICVKMITGDHVATAQAIGRQLGIGEDETALSGIDVEPTERKRIRQGGGRCGRFCASLSGPKTAVCAVFAATRRDRGYDRRRCQRRPGVETGRHRRGHGHHGHRRVERSCRNGAAGRQFRQHRAGGRGRPHCLQQPEEDHSLYPADQWR